MLCKTDVILRRRFTKDKSAADTSARSERAVQNMLYRLRGYSS